MIVTRLASTEAEAGQRACVRAFVCPPADDAADGLSPTVCPPAAGDVADKSSNMPEIEILRERCGMFEIAELAVERCLLMISPVRSRRRRNIESA